MDLAPVIVTGKRNPLDRSDAQLKALRDSLPGSGSEGPSAAQSFAQWYAAHRDINRLSPVKQKQLQHLSGHDAGDAPPDLLMQRP
jgi:hypothetical protein